MRGIFKKNFRNVLPFYTICAGVFIVGYFIGMQQNSGCTRKLQNSQIIPVEGAASYKYTSFLIVIIFSAPLNFEKRQVIRKTWLHTKGGNSIKHFFVIGSESLDKNQILSLQEEHKQHNDVLILDSVSDSFSKLSIKLLETLHWLDKYVKFTFFLKVDDDSFVRLDALYSKMILQPKERLYWGFFSGDATVKTKGKWREKAWFLCDHYLPYAMGGGYILTSDVVHKLVMVSDYLSLYQNEDVCLGTWLAPFDIKRLHDPTFDTEYMSRGCFNSYLVTHKQSMSMMITKYESLKNTGDICATERRDRNSYQYNWNVIPSLCCIRNDTRIP